MCKINLCHHFSNTIETLTLRKSITPSVLKLFVLLLLFACFFNAPHLAQADIQERVPVFLSDLSRTDPPLSMAKILIDAKRRTFTFGLPIYQCDNSVAEAGPPNTHGQSPSTKIKIQGKSYEKGIGIGTPFVLTYNLDGAYTSFSAIAGIEDSEPNKYNWTFEVYLDDVKAGLWKITKDSPATVNIDTTGARELVLVGAGPDLMMVNLAAAQLIQTSKTIKPAKINPTNRKAIFDLDDQLIIDSEVFLTGRSAKKIDSELGPEETAKSLGGFGRTTSTRGADMWAAIKDKGDLLRWQALTQRQGDYRVWTRVVSAKPNQQPNPDDYIVRIDGQIIPCKLAPQMIVERMPDEKFTSCLWGYIYADIPLEPGLHDVEVENASGSFLAVNRVVLVQQGTVAESLTPQPPMKPIAAKHEFKTHPLWEPKKLLDHHYVSADLSDPFDYAHPVDLMFAPTLTGLGAEFSNADDESIRQMLSSKLPFTIHVRFNVPLKKPVIDKETYERIKRIAGNLWQGFWTTEWSDCYNFSPEAQSLTKPKTRREGYEKVKAWYQQKASMVHDDVFAMCTSWPWDHYAGEWSGGSGIQDEPGISPRNQLRILFPRGAARQYQRIWHTYIAPGAHDAHTWIQNGYITRNKPHNTRQDPHGGSSISWVKRMMYLTYMWGTTSLKNETPAYLTDMTPDGKLALSPMGKVAADFYEFAATHKNRGTCYTPVGLMLDFMHGWGNRSIYPDAYPVLTWGCLQPEPSDYMKEALFDTIYPGQFDELNEKNLLSPTPYGDIFDVMLSSATPEHIQAYPVLFLVGDVAVDMNDTLASALETYVRNGGTLVINIEQISPAFNKKLLGVKITKKTGQADSAKCNLDEHEIKGCTFSYQVVKTKKAKSVISTPDKKPLVTRNKVGKGVVILTTVPYLLQENLNAVCFLPHLLEHLTVNLLPFRVDGDVEYVANRNDDSWLVTILNNRGVYKLATEPTILDKKQTQTAYITLGKKPSQLTDWITGKPLSAKQTDNNWQLTIDIPPGDLTIIQIKD